MLGALCVRGGGGGKADDDAPSLAEISAMFPDKEDAQAMHLVEFKDAIRRIYRITSSP